MYSDIDNLEEIIKYKFKSTENILVALKHPALAANKSQTKYFERLEFLGDKVLGLSIGDFLYEKFSSDSDGDLSVRISHLVNTESLIKLAKDSNIMECFSVPLYFLTENKVSSAIADMMEAVFASIFLDSDFKTTKEIITKLYCNFKFIYHHKEKDPKSRLQELMQAKNYSLPIYNVVSKSGDAHNPIFEVEVTAQENSTKALGNSKKAAEHEAAKKWLKKFSE